VNRPTQDWQDDDRGGDDDLAEARALKHEDAEDAREMRETGTYLAGERAAEFEAEVRTGL